MATGDAAFIAARGLRQSRRDPARTLDAAEGLEALNECHRAVLSDGTPWTFLEVTGQVTVAAGAQRYSFTSLETALGVTPIERVVSLINDTDGGRPLKGMHWKDLERLAYSTQDDPQSAPVAFAQIGLGTGSATSSIMLWPTPDQPYTLGILARRAVTDLVAADFPLIPAAHAGAVLTPYVAARMWDQQGGNEAASMAGMHDQRHERALRRLIDAYGGGRMEDITFIDPTLYDHLDMGTYLT